MAFADRRTEMREPLREAVVALEVSRREALLQPHLHRTLRPAEWLSDCPTATMLLSVARSVERDRQPSEALRRALHRVPGSAALLVEAGAILAEEPVSGGGAQALLPLLFEAPDLDRSPFGPVFSEALKWAQKDQIDARFYEAFAMLPFEVREEVVQELEPGLGGPHRLVPTLAMARKGVELLLGGEPDIGGEILASMRDDHVTAALREALADGNARPSVQTLAFTLPRGVGGASAVQRVVRLEPDTDRYFEPVLDNGSMVLDLAVIDDGILASCAHGALMRITATGSETVVPDQGLAPCRIVAVTGEEVVRWGWESLVAVARDDGKHLWGLELGHGLDEYDGECDVAGDLALLPPGWLVNLKARDFVPYEGTLDESWVHASDGEGLLVAYGKRVARLGAGYEQATLHELPETILAIAAADPLALVLDGGRVVRPDGTGLGTLTLESRQTDGRAQHYPSFPAEAAGAWVGDRLLVAMNDRGLNLWESGLSGVAVFEGGETVFRAEYKGRAVMTRGEPVVAVPDAVLVVGEEITSIPVPGLRPISIARAGETAVIGTADGLVVFVTLG